MNSDTTQPTAQSPKKLLLIIGSILIILVLGWILYRNTPQKPQPDLQTVSTEKDSTVMVTKNTSFFALEAYKNSLYTAKKEHFAAVEEFITSAPRYASTEFIPENFLKNSTLERSVNDKEDPSLQKDGAPLSNEHYFFNQTVNGIPVFNAQLIVHLRNNNEIYSVHGNLLKNTTVEPQKIKENQAQEIALQKARMDAVVPQHNGWDPDAPEVKSPDRPLIVESTKKYILNKKILGESEDEKNSLTLAVLVKNADPNTDDFAKEYFVDLATGAIVYEQDFIHDALSRQVACAPGAPCTSGRNEGQAPVSSQSINTLYDLMGNYYNFMFQTFQRDSINGTGGKLVANLKAPCKNASWNGSLITICSDMNTPDVVYHELTHGLTTFTAKLARSIQSGSLNEGNSDIFSIAIQPQGDYIMSGGAIPVIRNLQDPAAKSQPDTMFSPNFKCPGEVHHESTVMGHAFYLMAEGGTKNNCSISPIGKLNALKIQYLALTRYYASTANYRTHYTALMNACNDLFQQGSSTCRQVQAALVATQIDQQPANTQTPAKCSGIAPKAVVCPAQVGAAPTPSASSGPTATKTPTAGPTRTPTTAPLPTSIPPTKAPTPKISAAQPTMAIPLPTFTCLGSCPTPTGSSIIVEEDPTHTPAPVNQPIKQTPPPSGTTNQGLLQLILQLFLLFFRLLFGV